MLVLQNEEEMIVWTLAVSGRLSNKHAGYTDNSATAVYAAQVADHVVEEFRKRIPKQEEK